jgi:hypothetical protein
MAHHRESRWSEGTEAAADISSRVFGEPEKATVLGTVERTPASDRPRRVYFIEPSGRRWRVYDAVYGPPDAEAWREIAYPAPRVNAQHRIFIAENGERRLFSFKSRHAPPGAQQLSLDPQTVTDQFLWADYPASTRDEYEDPRRDRRILPDPKWTPTEQHALRAHTSNINRWTAFHAG